MAILITVNVNVHTWQMDTVSSSHIPICQPGRAHIIAVQYLYTNNRPTDAILDGGYLPHAVIRIGIRRQLAQRLAEIKSTSLAAAYERKTAYIERLRTQPIAIETATANTQHYEVRLHL